MTSTLFVDARWLWPPLEECSCVCRADGVGSVGGSCALSSFDFAAERASRGRVENNCSLLTDWADLDEVQRDRRTRRSAVDAPRAAVGVVVDVAAGLRVDAALVAVLRRERARRGRFEVAAGAEEPVDFASRRAAVHRAHGLLRLLPAVLRGAHVYVRPQRISSFPLPQLRSHRMC